MMKKLAKALSVLLVLVIGITMFAGCDTKEFGQGDDETLKESQYKGTEIKFKHFWVDAEDFFKDLCARYSRQTGVKVTPELQPVATYLTSINTNLQTDSLPEVFCMWPGASLSPYIEAGVLSNFNDIEGEYKERMSNSARAACTTNGGLYVVPVNNAFMGIAYNKSVFTKNSIVPPKNLADFDNILAKLKNDSSLTVPLMLGQDCPPNMVYLSALSTVYQKYPDFDDKVKAGTLSYNNADMQAVYRRIFIDWANNGYYNASNVNSVDRMSKVAVDFLDGKAAMMRIGSWDLNILTELNESDTQMGMFPMPGIDNDGTVLSAAGEAFALSSFATDNKRGAAIEFLNYLMSAKINGQLCGLINSLSPYEGVTTVATPMIEELSSYLDDTARGWNMAPLNVQNKMGEALDIISAASSNKEKTLSDHLNLLDRLWKEN